MSLPSCPGAGISLSSASASSARRRGAVRAGVSTVLACAALFGAAAPAAAADAYIALGDSITFGETDLLYRPSFGDRGYVAGYADALAARNGGQRPNVINLAIDGETASSFMTGAGRTPPVVGRTDVPLAQENSNYDPSSLVPQSNLFASTVAAQQAMGNSVSAVTITLGFNEVAALSSLPPSQALAQLPQTLADYRSNYSAVLTQVRSLLPNTSLSLLGYYNPFPADPSSPAAPIFMAGGMQLNAIVKDLAGQYGASFVDNAPAFVGNEALYTFLDEQPTGSSVPDPFGGVLPIGSSSVPDPFGGVLPIGNVHPNATGYDVIAAQVASVSAIPEPSTWAMFAVGAAGLGLMRRRAGRAR